MWKINEGLLEFVLNIAAFIGTLSFLAICIMIIGAITFGAYIWSEGHIKTAIRNRTK